MLNKYSDSDSDIMHEVILQHIGEYFHGQSLYYTKEPPPPPTSGHESEPSWVVSCSFVLPYVVLYCVNLLVSTKPE